LYKFNEKQEIYKMKFGVVAILLGYVLGQVPDFGPESGSLGKWKCGSSTTQQCLKDQTCCRGPSGWRCYPADNGVCCSDGISACPYNNTCDVQNKTCIPPKKTTLAFLDGVEVEVTEPFRIR
jgi:hypothetical protein